MTAGVWRGARRLSWLLAAAILTAPAASTAELSLSAPAAAPGSIALLAVTFASQSASVAALQFDLQYDPSVLSVSATVGDSLRTSSKALYTADIAPGRKRFLVAGLGANALVDGTLVNLFITVSPAAAARTYPLEFVNVAASDSSAQALPILANDGAVTVQGAAGSGPLLLPAAVLNAASLLPGPIAPGEILTLVGAAIGPSTPQLPSGSATATDLAGVSVQFGGVPAPLLFAGPGQINLIAPFGIAGQDSTRLRILHAGQILPEVPLSVTATSPAIFTADGSGVGPGAILNQDATGNSPSNPALRGSVIVLFASGAGQTDPLSADGQIIGSTLPKPLLPVTVQVGGRDAKVLYAGAAPGMVAGVLQVNCVVPLDSPPGFAVPVSISLGGISSPAGVTASIQ